MAVRGLRSVLQPSLYLGIAFLLHALLFLVPLGKMGRQEEQTTRGIRVTIIAQGPVIPLSAPPVAPVTPPSRSPKQTAQLESAVSSVAGNTNELLPGSADEQSAGGSSAAGSDGEPGNAPPATEYGRYLARLRSESVQGWARDTARSSNLGWKGTGVDQWGVGGGSGKGVGSGTGAGAGTQQGSGSGYLDPRVRMVVTSYPLDSTGKVIENRVANLESGLSRVPYPDRQFRKHEFTSGWWNVYIELHTDRNGKITRSYVLRPESDGPLERLFVDQVMKEIKRWKFDPVEAEIHVDVRFHVE